MDERKLRAFFRAAQPVLQRTAPVAGQGRIEVTPSVLDQITWGVVLAYVANVSQLPAEVVPHGARGDEGPLRAEEVYASLDRLKQSPVEPRLRPRARDMARFDASVRRLLDAYGWTSQRAAQVAREVAAALRSVADT